MSISGFPSEFLSVSSTECYELMSLKCAFNPVFCSIVNCNGLSSESISPVHSENAHPDSGDVRKCESMDVIPCGYGFSQRNTYIAR